MERPFISKSKYLSGLQCDKLLWHYYNAKKEIPPADDSTQAIFEQGYLIEEYAKKLFPDGIEIENGAVGFGDMIRKTAGRSAEKSESPKQLLAIRFSCFDIV